MADRSPTCSHLPAATWGQFLTASTPPVYTPEPSDTPLTLTHPDTGPLTLQVLGQLIPTPRTAVGDVPTTRPTHHTDAQRSTMALDPR